MIARLRTIQMSLCLLHRITVPTTRRVVSHSYIGDTPHLRSIPLRATIAATSSITTRFHTPLFQRTNLFFRRRSFTSSTGYSTMSAIAASTNPASTTSSASSSTSSASSTSSSSSSPLSPSILQNEHRADLSKEEYFDVLTASGEPTGQTKLRRLVHRDGDWHASVHIWLLHGQSGQLLLQQRAACKDSFPSCWDVSCAGHLSAGETPENAAQAELAEELGLTKPSSLTFSQFFHPLPMMSREVISQQGKFIDREHTYIYLVEGQWDLTKDLKLQVEEVEAVKWIELDELIARLRAGDPHFVSIPDLDEYKRQVFDKLEERIKQIKQANAK